MPAIRCPSPPFSCAIRCHKLASRPPTPIALAFAFAFAPRPFRPFRPRPFRPSRPRPFRPFRPRPFRPSRPGSRRRGLPILGPPARGARRLTAGWSS